MRIDHPAYQSDTYLLQLDGGILEEKESYWVMRFPRNPEYIWGNFLLLKEAPRSADFPHWMDISKKELGNTWFMAIGWQGIVTDPMELDPYLAFGFDFEQSDVLACEEALKPSKYSQLELRACVDDAAWDRVLENHKFLFARGKYKETQIDFFTQRFQSFRRKVESDAGVFFEAVMGEEIVGSLGVYHDDEQARFQEVVIYPRFRNMGMAQSMCYEALRWALEEKKLSRVLTVANLPEALHCYRNLGFQSIGIQEGLKWIDPRKYPKDP
jgi:RimJ/RimL family protein N-acetyltransferase